MAAKRDFYQVLGIDRGADGAAVKKAYRKLAKRYHPDVNAGNKQAEEKLKEVNEAYEVLKDEKKRGLYDKYGMMAFEPGFSPEAYEEARRRAGAGSRQQGGGWHQTGGTFHFASGEGADFFNDMFSDLFGTGTRHSRSYGRGPYGASGPDPAKGSDAEADVVISFDEAVLGCDKDLRVENRQTGKTERIHAHIPAGVDTGTRVRVKGRGGSGAAGGEKGDLYLCITVEDKPGYERRGRDLYTTLDIPYTTAVFGGKARVHTYYGDVVCRIKEGTQSGSKIRLRGKGVPSMKKQDACGDLYLTVQVQVPKHLSPEAEEKLREYQRVSGF